ncbi:MAG: enoyl-CoA hydratase [Betaproteobacteria bacterium]|nr:enoyl-CoA hydratase [Betaproteobacteria bacterium]
MSQPPVLMSVDARGVATLTLNRPEVGNAYDGALIEAAFNCMMQLSERTDLRVVVIRGNGRHFQVGADLSWLESVRQQSPDHNVRASRAVADLMRRLNHLPVPTVALVQGACFGGGTGLIASCDIVIGADNARFSIAETRWGMMAGIIIPQLNDAISVRQVRRYALTGERFDAAEALRIGLIHQIVPPDNLAAEGARIVDALLQNAPHANALTKQVALEYAWSDLSERDFDRLVEQHAGKRQSPEAQEGLASFHGKRPANWYTPT